MTLWQAACSIKAETVCQPPFVAPPPVTPDPSAVVLAVSRFRTFGLILPSFLKREILRLFF